MARNPFENVGETTRRGILSTLLAGGTAVGALSPLDELLDRVSPPSGGTWRDRRTVPGTVESPYGPATITYDDRHVPHVAADSEAAAYFAVGYAQAADRLFQMDVLRRDGSGRLAEVFGEPLLARDVFRTKMDFRGAIEASREAIAGTDAGRMLRAYADGVTTFVRRGSPGVEFGALDYDPEPWTVSDTLAVGMAMFAQQALSFSTLVEERKRESFGGDRYRELYPAHFDHGAPILREDTTASPATDRTSERETPGLDPAFVDWIAGFGGPETIGSNAWTVSGEHTGTGEPVLCCDPHLPLQAPPMLYQQRLSTDGVSVGGVAIPGIPFFFAGENDHGAWGFTAAQADVIDFYTYDTEDGRYRYGEEWREFETETRTVAYGDPLGGSNGTQAVEVRKTVHGPYVEREIGGQTHGVGIAWTPLTGVRVPEAMLAWTRAEEMAEFRAATRKWDTTPMNVHYVDDDGNTLYQFAARVPIRRVDGEVVRGDRVFDGSEGEAEWKGFEPYGQSSWDGFVPFEALPAATNPEYVASANQRPTDDPAYPLGEEAFGGFRAQRIYERLDRAVEEGRDLDRESVRSIQLDTLDLRARKIVPPLLSARDRMDDRSEPWVAALADWDYRMDRDSRAALAFAHFFEAFRERTWREDFEERGLGPRYWPDDRILVTLPPDSEFFDGDRETVLAAAMDEAVRRLEDEEWETYGDYNRPEIDHRLGRFVSGLNYPRYPTDGSDATVRPVYGLRGNGPSYRLLVEIGGESLEVLAGGNDGSPLSEHYSDQLRSWADGEYGRLDGQPTGGPDVTIRGTTDE